MVVGGQRDAGKVPVAPPSNLATKVHSFIYNKCNALNGYSYSLSHYD